MKKVLLIAAVAVLALASCKKEKTCTCTTTGADGYKKVTTEVLKGTKKHLKDECGRVETLAGGTTTTTIGGKTTTDVSVSTYKCELD